MLKLLEKLATSLGLPIGNQQKTEEQNNTNSSEKITIENPRVNPIEGTPFATVKKDDNQYVVIFGQHMITTTIFTSRGAAIKWASEMDWNTILNVVGIYVENALKNNELKKQN